MGLLNANNINNLVFNNDNKRRYLHKKLVEISEGGGGGGSQEWATNQDILSLFNDTYNDSVENNSIILGTPNEVRDNTVFINNSSFVNNNNLILA